MNEFLQRLLPNPFATDYTGKIADERMVDLYTEKELEQFAENIIQECGRAMEEKDSYYGEWMKTIINEHFGVE